MAPSFLLRFCKQAVRSVRSVSHGSRFCCSGHCRHPGRKWRWRRWRRQPCRVYNTFAAAAATERSSSTAPPIVTRGTQLWQQHPCTQQGPDHRCGMVGRPHSAFRQRWWNQPGADAIGAAEPVDRAPCGVLRRSQPRQDLAGGAHPLTVGGPGRGDVRLFAAEVRRFRRHRVSVGRLRPDRS